MAIWVNDDTRLLVQGITGKEGTFHALGCRDYGTKVVAGVTPGKGGETVEGIPVFDSVAGGPRGHGRQCVDDLRAAAVRGRRDHGGRGGGHRAGGVHHGRHPGQRHAEGEGVPARITPTRLIGPNCPGVISPGMAKIGIMPGHIHKPGRIGVVSRSGTLTYEAVWQLSNLGLGQSTCVGIGGDPINGTNFIDVFAAVRRRSGHGGRGDDRRDRRHCRGGGGGLDQGELKKPVVGFIAGRTAPPGRRMGHAGAIISGGKGTAAEKFAALRAAGIHVVESPAAMGVTMAKALGR